MKQIDVRIRAIALSTALALGGMAFGAAIASAEDAPAAAAAPDGKSIWNSKCKTCHGEDGKATKVGLKKGSPENLADKVAGMDHAKIVKVITDGDDKMPAFKDKLTAEEIEAVATYAKTVGAPTPKAP